MADNSVGETYKVLDEIEHIRKRPGMYAGSTELTESTEFVFDLGSKKMVKQTIKYIPAFIKICSEILDNAIDESKRAPDVLNQIRVDFFNDGSISITDNGRGIPVQIHSQTGKYIAETVFSQLRAGSNFNDDQDQQLIGTNGVGSTLTNVLSSSFKIESCDGKQCFYQEFTNGMRSRGEPVVKKDAKNRTKITFTPDYEFFKIPGIDSDHMLKITKKVVDAAACNPNVKFFVNGIRIDVKSFGDYISFYNPDYVADITDDWAVGISSSNDGFNQISFVNSVETYQGGTHVWYVTDQIVDAIRAYIKKKHKVEVKPADIRNHMTVYISANINRPKFSSQTKENMISTVSQYKTSWSVPDKMINKIIKSPILEAIMDWVNAKERAAENARLRELNKEAAKTNPKRVEGFDDAVEKVNRHNCTLYFTEGMSAKSSVQSSRGKNPYIGAFALRGKPLNVYDCTNTEVISNKEFASILAVTGLQLGEVVQFVDKPDGQFFELVHNNTKIVYNEHDRIEIDGVSKFAGELQGTPIKTVDKAFYKAQKNIFRTGYPNLRFGQIAILSDQDLDGFHISSLIISFFAKFWPELFDHGVICRMKTPLRIAKTNKDELEFFDDESYFEWNKSAPKHKVKYYKGLGTFTTDVFERFIQNPAKYLTKFNGLSKQDLDKIELAFSGTQQDSRKEWLQGINYFDEVGE